MARLRPPGFTLFVNGPAEVRADGETAMVAVQPTTAVLHKTPEGESQAGLCARLRKRTEEVRAMGGAIEMYRRSVEDFGQRVMAIGEGDWARPTPCTDWSVRDLVRHVVYEDLWAPPLLAGATIAEIGDRFEGDILGDDPPGGMERGGECRPGRGRAGGVVGRTVHLSFGDFPGPGVSRPADR